MKDDNHSVVYFINEEYGVVIRANGATGEVAMWEAETGGFTRRISEELADFLQHTDRFGGTWCPAHPTHSRVTAERAAAALTANLPTADERTRAKEAKLAAVRAELHERDAERMIAEITERWQAREAHYAGM